MHFLSDGFRFPETLAHAIARHFWKTPEPASAQLSPLGKTLAQLWPRLARERGQEKERHYSFDSNSAQAYAAYYLPANLLKIPLILTEAESFGLNLFAGGAKDWADIGCGPGTAYSGLAWWSQHRVGPARVVGVDQSPHFLRLATELQATLARELPRAVPSLSGRKAGRAPGAALEAALTEDPRIVSFVNSVGEIFPDPETRADEIRVFARELAVRALRKRETRWLLLVEPGTHEAGRELLALRAELTREANVHILLPCLDSRSCGALAQPKDWCHEEAACDFPPWLNELGSFAGLRKESLLFSYVLAALGEFTPPADWPANGARMVSQRLEHKGLTECWFCTREGKKRTRVSDAVQRKRAEPLALPARGEVFRELALSEKGEIEQANPALYRQRDFSDLFPPT